MYPLTELCGSNLLIYLKHIHDQKEGTVEDLKKMFSENFFDKDIGFIDIFEDGHWEISDSGESYYKFIFKND